MSSSDTAINWLSEPDVAHLKLARRMLKTNPTRAVHDLEDLAERGSIMSMVYLGWAYSKGDDLTHDAKKAEKWYRKATSAGSALASFYLGVHLLNYGIAEEAVIAFEIGANSGFLPSLDRLGKMYFYGIGVPENRAKAKELWQRAANLGHVRAKGRLGFAMAGGSYGIINIPRGVMMIISVVADIYRITNRNPQSDLLR